MYIMNVYRFYFFIYRFNSQFERTILDYLHDFHYLLFWTNQYDVRLSWICEVGYSNFFLPSQTAILLREQWFPTCYIVLLLTDFLYYQRISVFFCLKG